MQLPMNPTGDPTMKIRKIKKGLVVATVAMGSLAMGCELIVDFDRMSIPHRSNSQIWTPTGLF